MAQHNYSYQSDFAKKYYGAGREDGRRDALREQLELRFGELPAEFEHRLEQAGTELLSRWIRRVLTAATLAEVFGSNEP